MDIQQQTIAIFTPYYPPHMGGIERFCQSLAEALAKRGTHPIVITLEDEAAVLESEATSEGTTTPEGATAPSHHYTKDGVEIFRIPGTSFVNNRLPIHLNMRKLNLLLQQLASRNITGVLINARFYQLSVVAARFARSLGLCPVVLEHGSGYLGFGKPGIDNAVHVYEHVLTRMLKRFEPDFYAISNKSCDWLATFGIVGKGVIHNAIDAQEIDAINSQRDFRKEFGLDEGSLVIAFTGRILKQKGIETLVQVAELVGDASTIHFFIAGDGPDSSWLSEHAPSNMHVLGRLTRGDVIALLKSSDVFLFPSDTEGMPTSLLEAAACGLACVSTDVGGAREIIPDDSYGIVVNEAIPGVFAEILARYNEDRDLVHKQGARVRNHVMHAFSWDKTAAAVERACAIAGADSSVMDGGSFTMSNNDDLAASSSDSLAALSTSHRTRSYPPGVLQKLQETELKLLQGFDAACREAGLTYFLAAGTCLGAVRHGGFIPWDDDIDVGMPVSDYLKFQQIAPQILPAGISMHTAANTKGAPFLWTKLFLDGTRFLEEDSLQAGIEQGIFLDIFPYIGVSDNDAEAKREFTRYRSLQICNYIHHLAHPTGAGKDLKGRLLGAAFSAAHHSLGRLIKPKQLYKRFNAMLEQEKQGNHLINIGGKQFIAYPKSCIYPVQEINFAGIPCFAPHDTDTYLRLKYGDYMQLPSPENRHMHTPVLLDFGDGINAIHPEKQAGSCKSLGSRENRESLKGAHVKEPYC